MNCCQEDFIDQQGPLSSDQQRFLEFGLQERDPGQEGNSNEMHYPGYVYYTHYTGYIN